jgi:hypothetical protein
MAGRISKEIIEPRGGQIGRQPRSVDNHDEGGFMPVEAYRPAKLFTVQTANAMLPLVRAIARDLARLSREVIERRQRLDH